MELIKIQQPIKEIEKYSHWNGRKHKRKLKMVNEKNIQAKLQAEEHSY